MLSHVILAFRLALPRPSQSHHWSTLGMLRSPHDLLGVALIMICTVWDPLSRSMLNCRIMVTQILRGWGGGSVGSDVIYTIKDPRKKDQGPWLEEPRPWPFCLYIRRVLRIPAIPTFVKVFREGACRLIWTAPQNSKVSFVNLLETCQGRTPHRTTSTSIYCSSAASEFS